MTDSRWIIEKRGDVAKLLVDALSLIGHQSYLPSEANSGQNSPALSNKQGYRVPTLNLHNLNSPRNSPDRNYDIVPRLKFHTSPEKRCVTCSYVCTSCGNALSARDDALSISVLSDRSRDRITQRTSSEDSARMLLEEYPGVYQNANDKEVDKESVKRRGFIENSILRSAGLSFDNSRNKQLATLKDDLMTKGGFSPQAVPIHTCDSSGNSSDTSQEGEIVSVQCVDPVEYLKNNPASVSKEHQKERRISEETESSGSEGSINEGPGLFENSSLTNPTTLTPIKEDKPKPLQDSQLSPFEEKPGETTPPVNGQRVLPDLSPLLKNPARVSSPGKRKSPSGKRKVSLGFTASDFPQKTPSESGSQSAVPVKSKTISGKGIKKFFGWKK